MVKLIARLVGDFELGKLTRRQRIPTLTAVAAAGAAPDAPLSAASGSFKTVEVNHNSYQGQDYRVTRDFYVGQMDMKVAVDDTRTGECVLTWGRGTGSYLIPRNHRTPQKQTPDPNLKPVVDQLAFTIENGDKNAVENELKARGLDPRPDADYSFHIKDPDGCDLQICGPGLNATHPICATKRSA